MSKTPTLANAKATNEATQLRLQQLQDDLDRRDFLLREEEQYMSHLRKLKEELTIASSQISSREEKLAALEARTANTSIEESGTKISLNDLEKSSARLVANEILFSSFVKAMDDSIQSALRKIELRSQSVSEMENKMLEERKSLNEEQAEFALKVAEFEARVSSEQQALLRGKDQISKEQAALASAISEIKSREEEREMYNKLIHELELSDERARRHLKSIEDELELRKLKMDLEEDDLRKSAQELRVQDQQLKSSLAQLSQENAQVRAEKQNIALIVSSLNDREQTLNDRAEDLEKEFRRVRSERERLFREQQLLNDSIAKNETLKREAEIDGMRNQEVAFKTLQLKAEVDDASSQMADREAYLDTWETELTNREEEYSRLVEQAISIPKLHQSTSDFQNVSAGVVKMQSRLLKEHYLTGQQRRVFSASLNRRDEKGASSASSGVGCYDNAYKLGLKAFERYSESTTKNTVSKLKSRGNSSSTNTIIINNNGNSPIRNATHACTPRRSEDPKADRNNGNPASVFGVEQSDNDDGDNEGLLRAGVDRPLNDYEDIRVDNGGETPLSTSTSPSESDDENPEKNESEMNNHSRRNSPRKHPKRRIRETTSCSEEVGEVGDYSDSQTQSPTRRPASASSSANKSSPRSKEIATSPSSPTKSADSLPLGEQKIVDGQDTQTPKKSKHSHAKKRSSQTHTFINKRTLLPPMPMNSSAAAGEAAAEKNTSNREYSAAIGSSSQFRKSGAADSSSRTGAGGEEELRDRSPTAEASIERSLSNALGRKSPRVASASASLMTETIPLRSALFMESNRMSTVSTTRGKSVGGGSRFAATGLKKSSENTEAALATSSRICSLAHTVKNLQKIFRKYVARADLLVPERNTEKTERFLRRMTPEDRTNVEIAIWLERMMAHDVGIRRHFLNCPVVVENEFKNRPVEMIKSVARWWVNVEEALQHSDERLLEDRMVILDRGIEALAVAFDKMGEINESGDKPAGSSQPPFHPLFSATHQNNDDVQARNLKDDGAIPQSIPSERHNDERSGAHSRLALLGAGGGLATATLSARRALRQSQAQRPATASASSTLPSRTLL